MIRSVNKAVGAAKKQSKGKVKAIVRKATHNVKQDNKRFK